MLETSAGFTKDECMQRSEPKPSSDSEGKREESRSLSALC